MFEKTRVAKYVLAHQNELDKIMRDIFEHWNKIGQIDKNEEVSNKMQVIFLLSVIRVWLTTSGMPKETQKKVLQELINSLGD
jgi:hypothetical protein